MPNPIDPRRLTDIADAGPHPVRRASDLRRDGLTAREISRAVAGGVLVAVRRGAYLAAGAPPAIVLASSFGGRSACVSVLAAIGVFVLESRSVHVHFERSVSKRRTEKKGAVWHWSPLLRSPHPRASAVSLIDAVAQAAACQSPRAAIATLDSALHKGVITVDDLDEIFARVPPRRRVLRRLIDGRAESGPESLMRLIALSLGFTVELQVKIAGVGRVDLVLDGWLVVECDSEEFHRGWVSQKRDRRRDLLLAARGYASLRPIAEDILWNPELVSAALRALRLARVEGFEARTA